MRIGVTDFGGIRQATGGKNAASGEEGIGLSRKGVLDGPRPDSPLRRAIEQQNDQAEFSPEGLAAAAQKPASEIETEAEPQAQALINDPAAEELSEEEQRELDKLEKRDQEVRRHEQAHKAAAGSYARGGANLEYTTGPDGKRYATGGNVKIDVSTERTPQATIQKMKVIERAAMAPADPSAQDRAVYRTAVQQEQAAREQLAEEQRAAAEAAAEQARKGAELVKASGLDQPTVPTLGPIQPANPQTAVPRVARDTPAPKDAGGRIRPGTQLQPNALAPDQTPRAAETSGALLPEQASGPLARQVAQNSVGSEGESDGYPGAAAEPRDPFAPQKRSPTDRQGPPTVTLDQRI